MRSLKTCLAVWALLLAAMLLPGCTRHASGNPPASPTSAPTLRSLAQARGLWVGTAIDPGWLAGEPDYASLLGREFNAVTPENVMKFELIHPEPERYDFTGGDAVVAFAQTHGMLVRGHTLVWDSQLPDWVRRGSFTRDEWKDLLREHIQTVVGHYRGQVAAWDVVNEALTDDGLLRDTIWLRAIGPEYIALAFQWTHATDPDARLFYNENGGEGMNRKSQAVYALVQGLLQAGVPIHGVGMQMHTWLGGRPSHEALAANLARLDRLGLEVHITEMDVRIQYSTLSKPEKLAGQAEKYSQVFAACIAAPNCKAFVTWGLTDRHSWIPGFTGHPDSPLLFDESGQPKPAYFAILNLLSGR